MRVLFDTNVVLDVLLAREPHALAAGRLLAAVDSGRITGLLGATTLTTVEYLATKVTGARTARGLVAAMLDLFEIAAVDGNVLRRALDAGMRDFEDAVLAEAAVAADAVAIVTRDASGFRRAALPVMSPEEMLAVLGAGTILMEVVPL